MKPFLLTVLLALIAVGAMHAQSTFMVEWRDGETIRGTHTTPTLECWGTLKNLTGTAKQIRFRFNVSQVVPEHSASFCFGDLCFPNMPGDEEFPRSPQNLAPNGSLSVHGLLNNSFPPKVAGTSIVWYEMYDVGNPNDKLSFTLTYIFDQGASVPEAAELGINVSPTPATDHLNIQGGETARVTGVSLYSATGAILRSYGIQSADALSLDLQGLAAGAYHLLLSLDNNTVATAAFTIVR